MNQGKVKRFIQQTREENPKLGRIVLIVLILIFVVGIIFSGYYYLDRYVRLDDKSPLELGIDHLEQMVRENPNDLSVRLNLAQVYFDNGMWEETIEQANQVLAVEPENDSALYILGLSTVKLGNTKTAVEILEQFAALRRESPTAGSDAILEAASYYLGDSYLKLEQPEKAIEAFQDALVINFTDADALYLLGVAYARTGDHQMAVEQYLEAQRFVPTFIETYQAMAESYSALGMTDHVAYARGMEAFSKSNYSDAREQLEQAATALPDFAPAFLGLGLAHEALGEFDSALIALHRCLELNPDSFMARNTLERIELSMEQN